MSLPVFPSIHVPHFVVSRVLSTISRFKFESEIVRSSKSDRPLKKKRRLDVSEGAEAAAGENENGNEDGGLRVDIEGDVEIAFESRESKLDDTKPHARSSRSRSRSPSKIVPVAAPEPIGVES